MSDKLSREQRSDINAAMNALDATLSDAILMFNGSMKKTLGSTADDVNASLAVKSIAYVFARGMCKLIACANERPSAELATVVMTDAIEHVARREPDVFDAPEDNHGGH